MKAAAVLAALWTLLALVSGGGAELLVALSFYLALVEGPPALAAACRLSGARWSLGLEAPMVRLYRMVLPAVPLFLVLAWRGPAPEATGFWFHRGFFAARNLVALLLVYLCGRKLERNAGGGWAAGYLLAFVLSHSLVAFDWIMPLGYPWVSTLLGGYMFVESFYAGIALALVAAASRGQRGPVVDLATMLFGFSLLWAGLFYAQFLVIWYGNLPEEVGFLADRLLVSPYREVSWGVLAALFLVPFPVLLSRKAKAHLRLAPALALLVLLGIMVERILLVAPSVPVRSGVVALELLLATGAVVGAMRAAR